MPLNPDAVNDPPGPPSERSWNSKDALLYAVGVGAGSIDPTGFELEFTTENSKDVQQRVLPTFAVIIGIAVGNPGTFNPAMLVHGEQAIELHGEIPVEGTVSTTARITAMYDKGSAAVVVSEATSVDVATGKPLITSRNSMFIRGEGGWGGDRGPSGPQNVAPDREPDHVVTYDTRLDQALTYRLSGDRNPLHSDPEFAKAAGSRSRSSTVSAPTGSPDARCCTRCAAPTRPSSRAWKPGSRSRCSPATLTVKMWVDGNEAIFRTERQDGDVVIDQGRATFLA